MAFKTFVKRLLQVGWTAAIGIVAGCCGSDNLFHSTRVNRQDLAGSTHMAVLSVAPWDRYRDALQPSFKLAADDALKTVIPDTLALEQKTVDALALKAKVALPTSGTTSSQTITRQTGQPPSETNTVTQSTAPGDVSKVTFDNSPTSTSASSLPPGTSVLGSPLGEDPMLRYWVATALFQEVQLLDRYVRDAAVSADYYPYLLRMQVTLMPRQRDLPYDAYTTISLFQGDFGSDVPLLRSYIPVDAVSQLQKLTPDGKSTAAFRQELHDNLSRIPHVTAINPGHKFVAIDAFERAMDERSAVSSTATELAVALPDVLNTAEARTWNTKPASAPRVVPLLVTDNLEAAIQSSSVDQIRQLALALAATVQGIGVEGDLQKTDEQLRTVLGRDFNSTFTVARASDNTVRLRFGASLQAQSHYAMIPQAHNVTLLVLVPKAYVDGDGPTTLRLVSKTTFTDAECGNELPTWSTGEIVREREALLTKFLGAKHDGIDGNRLLQLADMNDYAAFAELVATKTRYPETLWLELLSLRDKSQYAFARVDLPRLVPPLITSGQTAALLDDLKTGTTAVLRGEGDLYAPRLGATLKLLPRQKAPPPADQSASFTSTATKVSDDGHSVMFTFPSLKTYGLTDKDGKLKSDLTAQIEAYTTDDEGRPISKFTVPAQYVGKSPGEPAIALETRAKVIESHDGAGEAQLVISKMDNPPPNGWDITLSVDGADLDGDPSGEPSQPTPIVSRDKKSQEIKLSGNGTVTLKFKNLNPVSNVTITAKDNNTGQSTKPIVLFVMEPGRAVGGIGKDK